MNNIDRENWENVKEIIRNENNPDLEFGAYWKHMVYADFKHMIFTLSSYKFVSKLLMYRKNLTICELGCNEAWGALMLQQNTDMEKYLGIDLDTDAIAYNKRVFRSDKFDFLEANFFEMKINERFDAVISLDVIEHINPEMEHDYCQVIVKHLNTDGVAVVGTPNITMSPYASKESKIGHINLYDQKRLANLMQNYFENVFIFGMNDEVVHTGFAPMSCYIFAVCTGKKELEK